VVRTLAEKLAGQAAVLQINTQDSPDLAARFNIRGVPAIVLVAQGRSINQLSGAQPLDLVLSWFHRNVVRR
jgi:thioredoxin 2